MQDPEIDKKIEDVKQLIQIWHQFYNILIAVFSESEDITKLDVEFQKIKTLVAQKHATLMTVVSKDHHIAQTVLATVRRTISLQEFKLLSGLEINKVIIEWHDANILLNETLGNLEYQRDSLSEQTATGKATQEGMANLRSAWDALRRSPYIRTGFKLVVVGGIIAGVYIYRHEIAANEYYQKYLKTSVDWIGDKLGIAGMFD